MATPRDAAVALLRSLGDPPADPSLATGAAGTALALHAGAVATGDAVLARAALAHADAAAAGLAGRRLDASLLDGVAGVAWALAVVDGADGAVFDPVDEALAAALAAPWRGRGDLGAGAAGIGVYAIARLPDPAGAELLEAVVGWLAAAARGDGDGITWWTPPELLPQAQSEAHPDGHADLGAAHGAAGIVALLGAAAAAGVSGARELALAGARGLLCHELPGGGFPDFAGPGCRERRARLAWCYGELGIAAALDAAGDGAGAAELRCAAARIAEVAARRSRRGSGVRDLGLCHGAAGVAHLLGRLARSSGSARVDAAARSWRGLAHAAVTRRLGRARPPAEPGLLAGRAGLALALLGAPAPAGWDAVLVPGPPRVAVGAPG